MSRGVELTMSSALQALIERLTEAGAIARSEGRDMLLDLRADAQRVREELEARIEQRVGQALDRLRPPTRAQFDELQAAVARLSERLDALERDRT